MVRTWCFTSFRCSGMVAFAFIWALDFEGPYYEYTASSRLENSQCESYIFHLDKFVHSCRKNKLILTTLSRKETGTNLRE